MKIEKERSTDLFWDRKKFIIPIYQRKYVWDKKMIIQLLDDIKNNRTELFLGMIIIKTNSVGERILIDGQQRITTLALIIKIINKKVRGKKWYSA